MMDTFNNMKKVVLNTLKMLRARGYNTKPYEDYLKDDKLIEQPLTQFITNLRSGNYDNKDRKDDFIYEAKYIIQIINKDNKDKSLDISHGIKTMEIIYKLLNTK